MGPVPIYTSTAPEPEPSFPSAAALCMQFRKRHLTKSPFLHKSGAASTAQGITQRSPTVSEPHVPTQRHCAAMILQVLVPALERRSRESQPSAARFKGVHRGFGKACSA